MAIVAGLPAQRIDLASRLEQKDAPALLTWVEKQSNPSGRGQILRLSRAAGPARSLEIELAPETLVARARIKLKADEEGFSPLLSWDSIQLGMRFAQGAWQLYRVNDDFANWEATEFSLAGAESHLWLNIDLIRQQEGLFDRYLVAINGALVSDLGYTVETSLVEESVLRFHQLAFGEIKVGGVEQLKRYPAYVQRAFRLAGSSEYVEDAEVGNRWQGAAGARSFERRLRSDAERKASGRYPDIRFPAAAGELSYLEEVWAVSMTVNRRYYAFVDGFRLDQPWRDEARLQLKGADYLPTLESRGWSGDFGYNNYGDRYIEKIYGYIVPPESGQYTLWLAGDEQAALFLSASTSERPQDLKRVASVETPTGPYAWTAQRSQRSHPLKLEAGVPVYFELWHLENVGDDHLAVAWSLPGQSRDQPTELIPGSAISSHSANPPGTWPRLLYPGDPSLLPELPPMPDGVATQPLSLSTVFGTQVLGDEPITQQDFEAQSSGWIFHAFNANGNGLGWLWTDDDNYPWMGNAEWWFYQPDTANPQWFFSNTSSQWIKYDQTPVSQLVEPTQDLPKLWNFESGLDGLANATYDHFSWILDSGGTPSGGTGPSRDHTLGTSTGHYVFMETSVPFGTAGTTAVLETPYFAVPAQGAGLTLFYHMYGGKEMGELRVEFLNGAGHWNELWSLNGPQSEHTTYTSPFSRIDLLLQGPIEDLIKLRFKGTAAGPYQGDMAIDDISIYGLGADADGDGLSDRDELIGGLNPNSNYDADGDGLSDDWETFFFGSPTGALWPIDSDGDGLSNRLEFLYGTDPHALTASGGGSAPILIVF